MSMIRENYGSDCWRGHIERAGAPANTLTKMKGPTALSCFRGRRASHAPLTVSVLVARVDITE